MTTVIVDYESGNLHSAQKAFQRMSTELGLGDVIVTSDPDQVRRADRIVLPGDGAFPACRAQLFDHRGLFEAMDEAVRLNARPFLGICIGMQMLASKGLEYTPTDGFDWISGTVTRITPSHDGLKVPHMGWNDVALMPHAKNHPVLEDGEAYFLHSYHFAAANGSDVAAMTNHGEGLVAAVAHDNILGVQFHPEKSQAYGLAMLERFLEWRP